ncbi:MAG: hypothetical protein HOY76_11420 [Streptomyces sp.]|nr:hypothetical protein [Streptomyces sp.]NUS10084.1 hypothetical protein [Streptomyces sp.]
MTTSAHLDAASVPVLPGEQARVVLEVRNSSAIVEAYTFEVLGAPAAWSVVEPAGLSLNPGTAGQVTVVVSPPRDTTVPPGDMPLAVRVLPQELPDWATVPEGTLHVLPYAEVTAELTPQMTQSRGRARFRVAIDNRGNHPLAVSLRGADRSQALVFGLPKTPVTVDPGRAAFVQVPVRAKKRLWRGVAVPHAFQLTATPASQQAVVEPVVLDGTYVQQPVLSSLLLRAVAAVLALALALVGVWYGLLKPAVRSAAKEAVKDPIATAATQAASANQKAEDAKNAANGAEQAAKKVGATPSPLKPGEGPEAPPDAELFSTRLSASASAGATRTSPYTVPPGKTLRLTDLVLENPQGDQGRVTIAVGGKTLLAPALENFREQDFHWASAILVTEGQKVTLTVSCRAPGTPPGSGSAPTQCASAALISGTLE